MPRHDQNLPGEYRPCQAWQWTPKQTSLPDWRQLNVEWRRLIHRGLSEFAGEAGLGNPRIPLADGTLLFVWTTTTDIFIALPEPLEGALWLIAYPNPHLTDVSDAIGLLYIV